MAFSFPFFKKKPQKHVYFGFYYTESRITGFAFDIIGGKANILSQTGYDVVAGYDKMLEDTDNLISDLESKTKMPLDKTIFFLHSILLDSQSREIRDPHKDTLKKISKELELEPMGYIDVHEAVEGNMKEHSVINNILLELSTNQLAVFIYKGGIMTASQTMSRTDSVAADLESAIKMLPEKIVLPTKILLYGVGDLTKASADIAQYKWSETMFVQHPLIEILEDINLYQVLADTFVEELVNPDHTIEPEQAPSVEKNTQETPNELPFGFVSGVQTSFTPHETISQPNQQSYSAEEILEEPEEVDKSPVSSQPMIKDKRSLMKGIIVGGSILFLSILFGLYEFVLHKVTIEIKLPTESISQDFDLTIPIVEAASNDLAIIQHSKVIEYDEEKSTTGKRDVGEKAKGDVILHNFDNSEKTIERGTELKSGNLLFILDSDVKIASSSGISSDGVKQSGKQKATATAKEIGPEYNISKGTQLKIGNLSDSLFIAIVDSAFTGGTKKQVTTVSKSDLDALKKTVEEEIKKQAKSEVEKLVEQKDSMISELTSVNVTDTEYSGEIGEEAKNISIKASSEINYYTFEKKYLQKKLHELFEQDKKSGYNIAEDIEYSIKDAEITKDNDEATIEIKALSKQYKQIDSEKIKDMTTFKQASTMENSVRSAFPIDSLEVKSANNIPVLVPWMPLFKNNINIKTIY